MKLHWSPKSPYVRKVLVCAHELGMTEQLELVRSVAAMLVPNEALMRDNPLSKIPTLVLDDGRSLFDSVVICEYLNERAKGPLFPAGDAKWQNLRWHAFGDGLLDVLILWRNERDRSDTQRSSELIAAFDHKTRASLHQLDTETPELHAAPWAMGHLTIACALGYLDFRFGDLNWRDQAPQLAQWYETASSRPSFQATSPTLEG